MSNEIIFSGLTSQSAARVKESKDERKEEEAKKRNVLLPAGQLVKDEFEKEIDRISHIDYVELGKLADDFAVKAELMAQKRTIEILRKIEQRLTNILRDNK